MQVSLFPAGVRECHRLFLEDVGDDDDLVRISLIEADDLLSCGRMRDDDQPGRVDALLLPTVDHVCLILHLGVPRALVFGRMQ